MYVALNLRFFFSLQQPKAGKRPSAEQPFASDTEARCRAKVHRGDARRCRRAWLIRVLRTSVQELENRTAFDESATHDDAQWERFMQQVTDLTRLARHHPETMNVDQIHVHVLPHIAKCASHTRTTLASTTIECLGQHAKLDISKALRIQWIAHIVPRCSR